MAGDYPVSKAAAARIFSLPMHLYLKKTDLERIIEMVRKLVFKPMIRESNNYCFA